MCMYICMQIYIYLGNVYFRQEKFDFAEHHFRKVICIHVYKCVYIYVFIYICIYIYIYIYI